MVSIEDRRTFYDRLEDNSKTSSFYHFWFKNEVPSLDDIQPGLVNELYYYGLISLGGENKNEFLDRHTELKNRIPSSSDTYLYDEYLMSVLVLNTAKYDIDNGWLVKAISVKKCANKDCERITESYLDLLNRSKPKYIEGILLIKALNEFKLDHKDYDSELYEDISSQGLIISTNDIVNILRLRCYDQIVQNNLIENKQKLIELNRFEIKFLKRVNIISSIIYYGICLLVIYKFWMMYNDENYRPYFERIDVFFAVMTVIGFGGIISNILSKNRLSKLISRIIWKILGYE